VREEAVGDFKCEVTAVVDLREKEQDFRVSE